MKILYIAYLNGSFKTPRKKSMQSIFAVLCRGKICFSEKLYFVKKKNLENRKHGLTLTFHSKLRTCFHLSTWVSSSTCVAAWIFNVSIGNQQSAAGALLSHLKNNQDISLESVWIMKSLKITLMLLWKWPGALQFVTGRNRVVPAIHANRQTLGSALQSKVTETASHWRPTSLSNEVMRSKLEAHHHRWFGPVR